MIRNSWKYSLGFGCIILGGMMDAENDYMLILVGVLVATGVILMSRSFNRNLPHH